MVTAFSRRRWPLNGRMSRTASEETAVDMDGWDFHQWRTALANLPPRQTALVGLAAAERIAGALRDPRFHRYSELTAQPIYELLDQCWSMLAAPHDALTQQIQQLADLVDDRNTEYHKRSMTELLDSYGPCDEPDEEAPDLEEFIEEAEPEGAVLLHLEALIALAEITAACAGGPWDGALRCLQTVAGAAVGLSAPTDHEPERQRRDLALVQAHGTSSDVRDLAAALRDCARTEATDWHHSAEQLALHHN